MDTRLTGCVGIARQFEPCNRMLLVEIYMTRNTCLFVVSRGIYSLKSHNKILYTRKRLHGVWFEFQIIQITVIRSWVHRKAANSFCYYDSHQTTVQKWKTTRPTTLVLHLVRSCLTDWIDRTQQLSQTGTCAKTDIFALFDMVYAVHDFILFCSPHSRLCSEMQNPNLVPKWDTFYVFVHCQTHYC